ncbi:MAG: NAD(P)-dependent oxidoreductase [Acidimicrobiales bacterium]
MAALGIVGVGKMGANIWRRLNDRGQSALVADASPATAAVLGAEGATIVADAAALAAQCAVVLLSLPTSAEVREVALGPRGLVTRAAPGTLVIDLTSGVPAASRAIGAELAERGIGYVDVGVSGGVEGARNGTLKAMAGGSDADFTAARPILDHLAPSLWHCGPVGAGHTVKTLLNQSNQAKLMVELEALLVAAKIGLDPVLVGQVLDTAVWNHWLFGPDGRTNVGFALALACKDFDIALGVAASERVGVPVAAAAQQALRLACGAAGPDADLIDTVAVWERIAGTRIERRTTTKETLA